MDRARKQAPLALPRVLAALGIALHEDGDQDKTFLFPVERFQEVAKIVKPLRRPALTGEQRAAKAARMKAKNDDHFGPFEARTHAGRRRRRESQPSGTWRPARSHD